MPIYLRIPKDKEIANLYDLLVYGYTNKDGERADSKFSRTYKTPDFSESDCHSARRSFDDLLEISRTYFPETLEKDLALCLEELRKKEKLVCIFCSDINRVVFLTGYSTTTSFKQYISLREINRKGTSNYCLQDILNLINE